MILLLKMSIMSMYLSKVKGKFLSIVHKLNLEDLNGNSRYYIEQKVFRLLPKYYIYDSNSNQVAMVKKQFT